MTWTKGAKPATTFSIGRKFAPMYLLNQTGGHLLFQSGLYINIGERQQNSFSMVAKPATTFTKVAKT